MPHPQSTSPNTDPANRAPLRALVADDDDASRRFLCDGLQSLGTSVQACADGAAALRLARAENFDLLLLDCRMPEAGALEILARLHEEPQAASFHSFAVATSAELGPDFRQSLLSAGFGDVLLKPCGLADLRRILLPIQTGNRAIPLLDDNIALLASGDDATMRALRSLLREELASLDRELDALNIDHARFVERLHRLRSSCGFCGAGALSRQVLLLQQQLERSANRPRSLVRFRSVLLSTMHALDR